MEISIRVFSIVYSLSIILLYGCNTHSEKNESQLEQPNSDAENRIPDQLIGNWIKPIDGSQNEYDGFQLNNDHSAYSINMHTLLYKKWSTFNNSIVLTGKSIGNKTTSEFDDTLKIVLANSTDLILAKDNVQFKYKKTTETKNIIKSEN